jgi:hypothetical protein
VLDHRIERWNYFSQLELVVINEALNTCFESSPESRRWDAEAQKIAETIPAIEDVVSRHILSSLNDE